MAKGNLNSILRVVAKILATFLDAASPEVREALASWLNQWAKKAYATDNPMDDILVDTIAAIVGVKIERETKKSNG